MSQGQACRNFGKQMLIANYYQELKWQSLQEDRNVIPGGQIIHAIKAIFYTYPEKELLNNS